MIVCTPKIDACCNWVFWGFFCGMVERMGRIDWTGWWAAPTAQTNAIVFFNFYFRFCFVWFYRQVPDFCLPYQDFVVVKESSTNNNLLKIIKPVQWGMLNIINSRNQRMHTRVYSAPFRISSFHSSEFCEWKFHECAPNLYIKSIPVFPSRRLIN